MKAVPAPRGNVLERGIALRWDDIYGAPAQSTEAEHHEAA